LANQRCRPCRLQRFLHRLGYIAINESDRCDVDVVLRALDRRYGGAELGAEGGGGAEEMCVAADASQRFEDARAAPAIAELPVQAEAVLQDRFGVRLVACA
jgi:hypothetical protein